MPPAVRDLGFWYLSGKLPASLWPSPGLSPAPEPRVDPSSSAHWLSAPRTTPAACPAGPGWAALGVEAVKVAFMALEEQEGSLRQMGGSCLSLIGRKPHLLAGTGGPTGGRDSQVQRWCPMIRGLELEEEAVAPGPPTLLKEALRLPAPPSMVQLRAGMLGRASPVPKLKGPESQPHPSHKGR